MDWPLVTGASAAVFPNLLAFLNSFEKFMPERQIYVADFGLTEGQRNYLAAKKHLLPMPEELKKYDHAWYHKGSLYDYVMPLMVDGFVWLDCDMMFTQDIYPALTDIAKEMQDTGVEIAICPDASGLSFQGFSDFGRENGGNVEPFELLVDVMGISMDVDYLNSGFMLFNGMMLPQLWGTVTRKQSEWLLFEQCSLNVLIYSHARKFKKLKCREWNAHGVFLKDVLTNEALSESRIIHITSDGSLHFNKYFVLDRDEKQMAGHLKLFLRTDLQKMLLDDFMQYIDKNLAQLIEYGVFQPKT